MSYQPNVDGASQRVPWVRLVLTLVLLIVLNYIVSGILTAVGAIVGGALGAVILRSIALVLVLFLVMRWSYRAGGGPKWAWWLMGLLVFLLNIDAWWGAMLFAIAFTDSRWLSFAVDLAFWLAVLTAIVTTLPAPRAVVPQAEVRIPGR